MLLLEEGLLIASRHRRVFPQGDDNNIFGNSYENVFLDDDLFLDGSRAADEKLTLPGAIFSTVFPRKRNLEGSAFFPPPLV